MYTYTDKALSTLNRQLVRLFHRLYLLNFDELNVVNQVATVYRQAGKLARKAYLDIAIHAYLSAFAKAIEAGFEADKPIQEDVPLDSDWIEEMLEEADAVTLYRYAPEWERKKQRLVEALAATNRHGQELDKALKYLVQQVTHYADRTTVKATLKGFEDTGVKKVMWVTERDERVCSVCAPLDGKIFAVDKVPELPAHYRCRCVIVPVR